ncbi:MAG: ribosomal protein L7/L12 [Anaerolineae bacterium]|nr:ribosomal protein L7/L12 [Anaerolineae bacterium]
MDTQSDSERIMILARVVKQLERKVDFILSEMNLVYDDFGDDDLFDLDDVRAALLSGNKIEAIKLYRLQTGVGLKEAKDAVDEMAKGY